MLFSIITVCFNSEKTIRRTFDAMLAQSCQDFEYIVIDGKSADHTVDIIREYEAKFNGKMRWISEPDNGLYDAMNKGIRMAQGELIGIINSDDYYHKDALTHVGESYREHPGKDVYYGIQANLNEQGEIESLERFSSKFLTYRMIEHSSAFIPMETYQKYGLYQGNLYPIAADYDLFLRIYLGGGFFQEIDYIISYFSSGGLSTQNRLHSINETVRSRVKNGLISHHTVVIRYLWNFIHVAQERLFERAKCWGVKKK